MLRYASSALILCSLLLARPSRAEDLPTVLRVCAEPNDLPYSNDQAQGFENKIALLIANHLGLPLRFVWRAEHRGFLKHGLNAGLCDLVTGVPSATFAVLTTRPYYKSSYVFVTRANEAAVTSLDDPVLHRLRIGVQMIGDDSMNSPPAHALAQRGIVTNVRGFPVYGDYGRPNPAASIVDAVASKQVDVAAVWGPIGGYFARLASPPLKVSPIVSRITDRIPMSFDISMGVRKTDGDLGEKVELALEDLRPQIGAILARYHVPIVTNPYSLTDR